jgi:RNA polymerase sigma factor (sigma-70 family)
VSSITDQDPSQPRATPSTDADLVEACRRGGTRAWERLVLRFERLIYTVPRRAGLSAEDADDVFQTVFMRLHERLDKLTHPERVQAWLVTIARRETLRKLGERRRSVQLGTAALASGDDDPRDDELPDPDPLPEQLLETLQLQHLARGALDRLAEPCRTLLELLYGRDEAPPYAEIAARLGMQIGSIGPTRSRCLAKVREMMERSP